MKNSLVGQDVLIHCYKHDGKPHRTWSRCKILEETDRHFIGINNNTLVTESDGRSWVTKEPAICYFPKDRWYNVICMIRSDGIYYYCNIASPILYDGEALKYIDYDLDLKVWPGYRYKVLDEGEYVDYIGIVLSGKLAVSNFYSTGDENLVNILEPSYSFGLEITCTYEKLSPFSIYALTDSEVFIFNQNAIFKKGTIPEEYRSIILQDVLKFVANENMRKYHKIKIISHYKLRQKIIAYLLFEKQKNKSDTFIIPYNRDELSKFLCVNRSALSHELSSMQKEGLIKFDKNYFEIISINL